MTRKWILLNLLLIALAASLVYLLRQHYREAQAHERAIFERAAQAKAVPPPPPLTPPAPVTAMQYFDVAQRNLFSSDRNPNVIIPPPPPPPAEKPMPALPAYFGQIGIGEPTVLLKPGPNDPQKRYHVGEKIGPFEVLYDGDSRTGIPAVSWTMRQGAGGFSLFDLSDRLRARGWQIAAYTMVPNIEDMAVMRVLIRHGFSLDLADGLLADIRRSLEYFEKHPITAPMTAQEGASHDHSARSKATAPAG